MPDGVRTLKRMQSPAPLSYRSPSRVRSCQPVYWRRRSLCQSRCRGPEPCSPRALLGRGGRSRRIWRKIPFKTTAAGLSPPLTKFLFKDDSCSKCWVDFLSAIYLLSAFPAVVDRFGDDIGPQWCEKSPTKNCTYTTVSHKLRENTAESHCAIMGSTHANRLKKLIMSMSNVWISVSWTRGCTIHRFSIDIAMCRCAIVPSQDVQCQGRLISSNPCCYNFFRDLIKKGKHTWYADCGCLIKKTLPFLIIPIILSKRSYSVYLEGAPVFLYITIYIARNIFITISIFCQCYAALSWIMQYACFLMGLQRRSWSRDHEGIFFRYFCYCWLHWSHVHVVCSHCCRCLWCSKSKTETANHTCWSPPGEPGWEHLWHSLAAGGRTRCRRRH